MGQHSPQQRAARILVVEDDVSISRLIGLALPELNIPYVFEGALNAEDALKLWESQPFDLVVADHLLPGISGLEFIVALKARGATARTVLITAYDTSKLSREARRVGVDAYIVKPFLMEDLINAIRRLLLRSQIELNEQ